MRRPHIVYSRPASSGALGLRQRSAGAAHQRVQAFLARATDCSGSRSISIEPPPGPAEIELFPDGGQWQRQGRSASWSARGRTRADDQPPVLRHDALAELIARAFMAESPFRATVSYQFLLQFPIGGVSFPYTDEDFLAPDLVWSDLLLFLEDRGRNALYMTLVFPWDRITPEIVAVHDALVDTMGLSPAPSDWKLRTPSKRNGGLPRSRKLGFDRAAWVRPPAQDEASLLAAIAAAPDSDEPRLVYADLLLEAGERRGELISVQCELDRLIRAGDHSPRRRALEATERRLLRATAKDAWRKVPSARHAAFRRGFVDRVCFESVSKFRAAADDVMRVAPTTTELEFLFPVREVDIDSLLAWHGFRHIRGLAILPRDGALEALARSPAAASLRRLATAFVDHKRGLETATIRPEAVSALAASDHLGQLVTLNLRGAQLDAAAVAGLVSSPCLSGLRALDLAGSTATIAMARARSLPPLTELVLGVEPVGDVHTRELSACPGLASLVRLELHGAGIGDAGAVALAGSPHLGNLEQLILSGNPIGPDGACALVASSVLVHLRRLNLDLCSIDDAGAIRLAELPELARLRSLSLVTSEFSPSKIGAAGLWAFVRSPFTAGLHELVLGNLAPDGAVADALGALQERLGKTLVVRDSYRGHGDLGRL